MSHILNWRLKLNFNFRAFQLQTKKEVGKILFQFIICTSPKWRIINFISSLFLRIGFKTLKPDEGTMLAVLGIRTGMSFDLTGRARA